MFLTLALILLFASPFILVMLGTYMEHKERLQIEDDFLKEEQYYNRNVNSYRSKPSLHIVRKDN